MCLPHSQTHPLTLYQNVNLRRETIFHAVCACLCSCSDVSDPCLYPVGAIPLPLNTGKLACLHHGMCELIHLCPCRQYSFLCEALVVSNLPLGVSTILFHTVSVMGLFLHWQHSVSHRAQLLLFKVPIMSLRHQSHTCNT